MRFSDVIQNKTYRNSVSDDEYRVVFRDVNVVLTVRTNSLRKNLYELWFYQDSPLFVNWIKSESEVDDLQARTVHQRHR